MDTFHSHLEELQMIRCSLLPGESVEFADDSDLWLALLEDSLTVIPEALVSDPRLASTTLRVEVDGATMWLQVTMGIASSSAVQQGPTVSVKGECLSRAEQEHWKRVVNDKMEEVVDLEFRTYNIVSLHLLPLLHEAGLSNVGESEKSPPTPVTVASNGCYHVLFTSHHLISPKKRRSLQQWSSSLSLSGFAKVGYPGVIYAQGQQEAIEEFTSNVKVMQWLALRARFMEPLPEAHPSDVIRERSWKEFQKVGEVVEEMRRIGREEYVIEMGIGSAGST